MLSDKQWEPPTHPAIVSAVHAVIPPLVISFLRWSTDKQEWGSTERRQARLSKRYADERGWEINDTLRLGAIPASDGRHRHISTPFGQFLDRVRNRLIPKGSVLIVEYLDRLSRQHPLIAGAEIWQLIQAGIEIHVAAKGEEAVYNKDTIRDPEVIDRMIDRLKASYIENERRRNRVIEAVDEQRELAIRFNRPLPYGYPTWIELVGYVDMDDPGEYKLIKARSNIVAKMVKKHLHLTAQEVTDWLIAKAKVDPRYKCWCDYDEWTLGTVESILSNPAVFGVRIFTTKIRHEEWDDTEARMKVWYETKVLCEKEGYYKAATAIPDPDKTFRRQLAEARRQRWRHQGIGGVGRQHRPYSNITRDIGFCECGAPLWKENPTKERGTQIRAVIDGSGRQHESIGRAAAANHIENIKTAEAWASTGRHGWRWGEREPGKIERPKLHCSNRDCPNKTRYHYDILIEQVFPLIKQISDKAPLVTETTPGPDIALLADLDIQEAEILDNEDQIFAKHLKHPLAKKWLDEYDAQLVIIRARRKAELDKEGPPPPDLAGLLLETYKASKVAPPEDQPQLATELYYGLRQFIARFVLHQTGEMEVYFREVIRNGRRYGGKKVLRVPPEERSDEKRRIKAKPFTVDVPALVAEIQSIFAAAGATRIFASDLFQRLMANEYRPWLAYTKHRLNVLLKPYGIAPYSMRIGMQTGRGYGIDQFTAMEAKMSDKRRKG
jgi:DNA invertase Pin-like site-specific DNA recombinase